jgi:hypothetical protein
MVKVHVFGQGWEVLCPGGGAAWYDPVGDQFGRDGLSAKRIPFFRIPAEPVALVGVF